MRKKFYIVNDVDRPCEQHVAQLTGPKKDKLRYIHESLRDWDEMDLREESTPVEEFGFEIKRAHDRIMFFKTKHSSVFYPGGGRRLWQGGSFFCLTPLEGEFLPNPLTPKNYADLCQAVWRDISARGWKVRVTPRESEIVQRELFKRGFSWVGGQKYIRNTDFPYLFFNVRRGLMWGSSYEKFKSHPEDLVSFIELMMIMGVPLESFLDYSEGESGSAGVAEDSILNPDGKITPTEDALEEWGELTSPLENLGLKLHAFSPGVQYICPDTDRVISLTIPALRRINQALKESSSEEGSPASGTENRDAGK